MIELSAYSKLTKTIWNVNDALTTKCVYLTLVWIRPFRR